MKRLSLWVMLIIALPLASHAQALLVATSPGRSYEQIDSTFGQNGAAEEETPDQCWSHPQFGRHILEVYDSTLKKYVFEFYIHVHPDNDRCINFDRQRSEIKTDSTSPSYLKGHLGNKLTCTWMFRLPAKFQEGPDFTHIHQIKAVDGDYSSPIFTLSPYNNGTKQEMQIVYTKDSTTSQSIIKEVPLAPFLGTWVSATENITIGPVGTYSIVLTNVATGKTILTYTNDSIQTIRPSNSFIRPKWGLYRSLDDSTYLRDDTMRLTNVYVFNNQVSVAPTNLSAKAVSTSGINLRWSQSENNLTVFSIERSLDSITWDSVGSVPVGVTTYADTGLLSNTAYYYRVKAENPAGSSAYTNVANATTFKPLPIDLVSFDASLLGKNIEIIWEVENEINFAEYELEHSNDGVSFNNLATITADGKLSYSYLQASDINANNYYRLKLVNKDGSFSYSKTVSVNTAEMGFVSIYPNPAKDFINVSIKKAFANACLVVMDAEGRKLLGQKLKNNFTGSITLPITSLGSGTYFLKLASDETTKGFPFIISK